MAQQITVGLEDDLDGRPADETVRSGLGSTEYEIDLSTKNATVLRKQLALFTNHARRQARRQSHRSLRTASSRERSADIRAWPQELASRSVAAGASPASGVEQYETSAKGSWPS